jgi:hypothetical protein
MREHLALAREKTPNFWREGDSTQESPNPRGPRLQTKIAAAGEAGTFPSGVSPMGQSTTRLPVSHALYLPITFGPVIQRGFSGTFFSETNRAAALPSTPPQWISTRPEVVTIERIQDARYNRLYRDPIKLTKYIFYFI